MKVPAALLLCILGLFSVRNGLAQVYTQPEQIHISLGAVPSQMIVTWLTVQKTNTSIVEYGQGNLGTRVVGNSTLFTDGGKLKRTMYIHRVLLDDLTPGDLYQYHCGSDDGGWSSVYWFRTIKDGTNWSPRFAIFGDLGNVNAQSIPRLQEEAQNGKYDIILHVGDFAYDFDTDDAQVGDEFMRQIEPVAAYVPYMTCVGNHENAYNFSNYVNRFSMVGLDGKINNHFYSFNVGPAHVIAFSTEFYFFVNYGWAQIAYQYQWLENDLKEANKPENRAQRPWIITMGHRPMYCSNLDHDDCTFSESIIRTGLPVIHAYGLEDLFYKYGVDLEFWAHEHSYERLWPVYNRTVYNGSYEEPYTNPKAPVHIVTGSAGCQEKLDNFGPQQPWSAFHLSDYGYTRMMVINDTHLYLEQLSDDQQGKITDSMLLVKEKHGPEAWL